MTSVILRSKLYLRVPSWKGVSEIVAQYPLPRAKVFQEWLPYVGNLSTLSELFLYLNTLIQTLRSSVRASKTVVRISVGSMQWVPEQRMLVWFDCY